MAEQELRYVGISDDGGKVVIHAATPSEAIRVIRLTDRAAMILIAKVAQALSIWRNLWADKEA